MSATIDWHGPRRQPCPACDKGQRDKALSITHDERGSVAHCFRCEYVIALGDSARLGTASRPVAARMRHEVLSDYGRELWDACKAVSGAAAAYLESRGCVIPPEEGDLRWHPDLNHKPSGYSGPALVALVTDAVDCTPRTLHRTWVRADGNKAPVDPQRMLLGGHRKARGVIRLWPDEAVTYGLGVAEGIESALSLAHGYTPVWACIDAGNLGTLPVLAGVESIVIAADHDDAGIRAAENCAYLWRAEGRDAVVVLPDVARSDLNDVARAA